MMSRDEIVDAARNMSDFLQMGEQLEDICVHMTKIQPKYAQKWKAIARESSSGTRLGLLLRKHRLWPDAMCAAVDAGEESGNLEQVLESVMGFQKELGEIGGVVKAKVITPSAFVLAGVGIFIGFMTFVLPGVSGGIKDPKDRTGLIAISDQFVHIKDNEMQTVGIIATLFVIGLIALIRSPAAKRRAMMMIDSIPTLGDGMRSVYFGLWAKFMVILDQANSIPIDKMIEISSQILPDFYRESTEVLRKEVSTPQGAVWATDHTRWAKSDPRATWPIRLKISMASAAATGNIEGSLGRSADPLIRDGVENITKGLMIFNLLAMAAAAGGILAPMAGMMLVQLQVVNSMQ